MHRARKLTERFEKVFRLLSSFPLAGRAADDENLRKKGHGELLVAEHLVVHPFGSDGLTEPARRLKARGSREVLAAGELPPHARVPVGHRGIPVRALQGHAHAGRPHLQGAVLG